MNVSWSLLQAYEKCPLQQKLIRIDKVGPKKVDERKFIAGTTGHHFFMMWAKKGFDERTTPELAQDIFNDLISKRHIVWFNNSDKERVRVKVIKEASKLIRAVRYHGLDKLNTMQIEKTIEKRLPFGNHKVSGIADIIAQDESWIIETKMTDDLKWADKDQLIFYGLLLGAINRRYPKRLSFFLPVMEKAEDSLIDVDFSKAEFLLMYKRICNFVTNWTNGLFFATGNAEKCNHCCVASFCLFFCTSVGHPIWMN
jgi:hypothetical protein